ncbi:MAG: CvpA family protein [Tenericutes bacterium]|nr:CvpA family protein [Mycoplasmatota bacterium]
MKNKMIFVRIMLMIIIAAITYYIFLPAFNFHSFGFYVYILFVVGVYKILSIIKFENKILKIQKSSKNNKILLKENIVYISFVIIFALIFIVNFVYSPIFFSKKYAKRIIIDETSTFVDDIKAVNYNALPLLDKDSSEKLGDRVMGQMSELVSQFEVSTLYTQINYNNDIIRVTPLEYASFIKWITNKKEGVKGYITVNSVSGESELYKLDKGMKYMPSAYFNDNLYRKLRFEYPTKIFGRISFEIDNDGSPYWIIPTISYSAVELLKEVNGLIILDPVSGNSNLYKIEDVPEWVDQVFDASLIIEQVNDWGLYKNGFLNSLFGQKGVVQTTEGYNYTIQDDDVFMYTGITSINSDESNIGFILTNLRTKETKFYAVPGAEEYSAMESAKGQVQQMNYVSSFPLLINLNSRPTYLISLKDAAGLVKMYAFVDVEDYQKVVVTDSSLGIKEASRLYLKNINFKNNDSSSFIKKEITISSINIAMIDGTTYFYIKDLSGQKYKVSIKVNENLLPFITKGNKLKINYLTEEDIIDIISID